MPVHNIGFNFRRPPAPASAEFYGFGANAIGGTTLYTVTNTNDSGAGTLRDALSTSGRLIHFSVSGTISLASNLYVPNKTTIRGFTSPTGITITSATGDGLRIHGPQTASNPDLDTDAGSHVIVQGLRFRDCVGDGIQIAYNCHDVIIDRCSSCNNGDGDIDVTNGAHNVTVSWCLTNNQSGISPGNALLSYNSGKVSYHHNIFYDGNDRNPILTHTYSYSEGGPSGPNHAEPLADVRYNIMWNYAIGTYVMNGASTGSPSANVASNLYKNNGSSSAGNTIVRARFNTAYAFPDAYIAGNASVHNCAGTIYMYGTDADQTRVTCNDRTNIAEVSAPAIPGPTTTNQQGRLDEWTAVKNGAGVIAYFTDDAQDSTARGAITIPAISIFTEAWNDG